MKNYGNHLVGILERTAFSIAFQKSSGKKKALFPESERQKERTLAAFLSEHFRGLIAKEFCTFVRRG